ncbi:hypothetical protein FVO59_09400 [Microbacterium esteraromaticum]|uniref:Uncharacterized protein n=1 Tax=Microbacterium esteraromaticum TaxID=57043 RepID=A0A7D8ALF7_9MICO|nr:hypothetical protein [Microbacterium esteraromaticum]QMU97407.1 hypothetical protein FVO59_09400 [Microbacterium esteraromaticum]
MSENEQTGISRRTVTKAMAWAVPAVAVASTVPFAAASYVPVELTGIACKEPGNPKYYRFQVVITNDNPYPVTVEFDQLDIEGVKRDVDPTSTTVPPNTKRTITIRAGLYGDSANGTATLYYTIDGVQSTAATGFNDLPPTTGGGAGCTLQTFPFQSDVAI